MKGKIDRISINIILSTLTGLFVIFFLNLPTKILIAIVIGSIMFMLLTVIFDRDLLRSKKKVDIEVPLIGVLLFLSIMFIFNFFLFLKKLNLIFSDKFRILLWEDWKNIQILDLLVLLYDFFLINVFLGYLMIVLFIDTTGAISIFQKIILSFPISIFIGGTISFIVILLELPFRVSCLILFLFVNLLVSLYIFRLYRSKKKKFSLSFEVNRSFIILLLTCIYTLVIVFSQYAFRSFIREDHWYYLASANTFIKDGVKKGMPSDNFDAMRQPYWYQLFISLLFVTIDFPEANALIILSGISILLPLSFYNLSLTLSKNRDVASISTMVYTLFSGFGWILAFISKIQEGLILSSFYQNIDTLYKILSALNGWKTIYEFWLPLGMPQGAVIKTSMIGLISLLLINTLIFNDSLRIDTKVRFITILVLLGFLVHIEEISFFVIGLLPIYTLFLFRDRKAYGYRLIGSFLLAFIIVVCIDLVAPYHYYTNVRLLLVFNILSLCISLIILAWDKTFEKFFKKLSLTSLANKICKSLFLKFMVLYLYGLASLVLIFYGINNMRPIIAQKILQIGCPYPAYYYPLRYGILLPLFILAFFSLSCSIHKTSNSTEKSKDRLILFFAVMAIIVVFIAKIFSYVNNVFLIVYAWGSTYREMRILYYIAPIFIAIVDGWYLVRKFPTMKLWSTFRNIGKVLLAIMVITGSASTLLCAEVWAVKSGPQGSNFYVSSADREAANFLLAEKDPDLRVAALSYLSYHMQILAGWGSRGLDAYPDLFTCTSLDTVFLLSSEVGYIYMASRDSNILEKYKDSILKNFLIRYLPVLYHKEDNFGNIVTIYDLPYFTPSEEGAKVHVTSFYDNEFSLLSHTALSLFGVSYDYYMPSDNNLLEAEVLVLLADPQKNAMEKNIKLHLNRVLNWVKSGGKLIVFGDENGFIFNLLNISIHGYEAANMIINTNNESIYLNEVLVPKLDMHALESTFEILSNYSLESNKLSPFSVLIHYYSGEILYYLITPIYKTLEKLSEENRSKASELLVRLGDVIRIGEMPFYEGQNQIRRSPLSSRWSSKYFVWGRNSAELHGKIHLNTSSLGDLPLKNITASKLSVTLPNLTTITYRNTMIDEIDITGNTTFIFDTSFAKIKPYGNKSYINVLLRDPIVHMYSTDSSNISISIRLEDTTQHIKIHGRFVVSIELDGNRTFLLKRPNLYMNGISFFDSINLDPNFIGNIKAFEILGKFAVRFYYTDVNLFFAKLLDLNGNVRATSEIKREPLVKAILLPWSEFISSIYHLIYITIMAVTYILLKRRIKNLRTVTFYPTLRNT